MPWGFIRAVGAIAVDRSRKDSILLTIRDGHWWRSRWNAQVPGLVDVSDPKSPKVINVLSLAPQIGLETVKFFRQGSRLFVASGNEVSGTVSILEVVF